MKRKISSLFTAFAMLMSLFGTMPITASAAEEPHTHPICGASCTHEDEHTAVEWTPLTQVMIDSGSMGGYNMLSGSYYLTEDITTENGITIGELSTSNINVNICFNGHTITCSNNQINRTSQIYVNANSSLTLCDCQGGGGFYSAEEVTRPLFWTDGSLNLYGGTLSGKGGTAYNTASSLNLYGGTLSNTTNTVHGSFTLDGAAIETTSYAINAQASSTVLIKSGSVTSTGSPSVLVYTTDFTMEGGTITNTNTKTTGNSYAIEFSPLGGSGTISGGVIQATGPTGSGIYAAGPNVVLSGNPTIEGTNADIRIGTSGKLTVGDDLEGEYMVNYSSPTKITEDAPYSFTTDDDKDNSAYFNDSVLSSSGLALRNIGEGDAQTVQIYRPHLLTAYAAKTPTCTETGNDAYWKCTNTGCGKLFSDADGETEIDSIPTINVTSHNMTHHETVPASCTETGTGEYWMCGNCNKMFSDANGTTEISEIPTIKATGHSLTHHAAVEPECVKAGNSEYWTCSVCNKIFSDANGETEISSIPVKPGTGHRSDSGTVITEPTCTEKGTKTYKCTVCGATLRTEDIDATGHSWGDWTITTEPTLTATGTAERICAKNNEHKDTALLPALTDTAVWTEGTTVEPTEEAAGSQEYTSDYGIVTVIIPALGHTHVWGDWTITAEPTLTATGTAEHICAKNNEHKDTALLPALTDTAVWTEGKKVEPTEDTDGSQEYTSDYGTVTVIIPATGTPTAKPTSAPTAEPTGAPTVEPTSVPTTEPTGAPTTEPTGVPITKPTDSPTIEPTVEPTTEPTVEPTVEPTASPASECFDIDGRVVDKDNNGVANVKLSLKRGNTTVTAGETPIETTTDTNGEFKFIGIASGVYNIVAEYTEGDSVITVTSLAEVKDRSISIILKLPEYKANSILKLEGNNTPDIIVGGLDELAGENAQPSENVTITMTVERKAKDSDNSEHNKIETISVNSNIDYFDIALTKTVGTDVSNLSETNKLLTIIIPFNTNGKKNIKVYRYHGNGAAALSDNPADSEYFSVSNGYIKVYASKFSTYAIGYDTETSEPTAEPTDEPTPTPTPKRSGGGSPSKKATPTPSPTALPSETAEPTIEPTQEPVQTDEVKQHKAYIVGYEGYFRPDGNITRAETAAIMARLTDGFDESGSYAPSFSDVADDLWYYKYIGFEESRNVITGYGDSTFKPEGNITRAEFAAIIVKFAGLDASNEAVPFTDTDGHWASEQIKACYNAGYIIGYKDNTFLPDNCITRAEAVAIINRVLDRDDIKDFESPFMDVAESHWAYNDIMEAAITHNAE